MKSKRNRRFFPYVLAHEIGHALGLQHAKKEEAIMYPFYKNIPLDEIKLALDDKCGINWNY
ncbi:Matrixin, partial [Necator americanus]